MKSHNLNCKGVILQPISRQKEPWSKYEMGVDFLTYFQNIFEEEIGNDFCVNHNTMEFEDYLLIPYYTENKKCFGAYYIDYGFELEKGDYSHCYHLNYSKSFNFTKEVFHYEIIGEVEFFHGTVNKVANENRVLYYQLTNLSEKFWDYIGTIATSIK